MALRSVDGSAIESPEGFPLVAILAGAGGTDIGDFFKNVLGLETWALIFAVEKGAQRTHGCGSSGRTGASLPRNAFASQQFFLLPTARNFFKKPPGYRLNNMWNPTSVPEDQKAEPAVIKGFKVSVQNMAREHKN